MQRPEPMQAVKALLLPADRKPGTLVVSAIYGLGGIGKSVLAAAMAHDPEVQHRFTDGVLWATLGQNPDLLPLLSGWIQALGDYDSKPTSLETASNQLRTLLYDKRMLLVVDDAWNPDHADPFRVGGDDCCVLVTTRSAQLSDVTPYDLDVMSESQSMELLSNALRDDLSAEQAAAAHELAREVGCLPLALELAASQVEDGVTWTELLQALRQEMVELDALDRVDAADQVDEAKRRKHSLVACFNLSLRLLTREQMGQFAGLGVLPEDVSVTAQMATVLWDMPVRQARKTLLTFKRKTLLLVGSKSLGGEATYRMHDLMHDLAVTLLQSPMEPNNKKALPGLGLTKAAAHGQLLERYLVKTQAGLWHTLPEDGYIHAHLTWHMEQAGQPEAIHGLLRETRGDGRNGWYEACDAIGQPAQFVSDLGRAWRLAEELYGEQPTEAIVLQCRYGLIKTTLNTLAKNIPAKLIAAFVKNGFWSPAQGLAYAQQAQQAQTKSRTIQAIARYLPEDLFPKALEMTHQIQDVCYRAFALSALAEMRPELYAEALEITRQIQSEPDRASVLSALAGTLPPELYAEALEVTRQIQSKYDRAIAFSALAKTLPPELYAEALEVTRQIQSEPARVIVISALAETHPEFYEESLKGIRKIQPEYVRVFALSTLAKTYPELYTEALEVARQIQDKYERVRAFSALTKTHPELCAEAIEVTRQVQVESNRAMALSALAKTLPPELYEEALEIARQIQPEYYRAIALSALAKTHPELYEEALEVTCQIQDESSRSTALIELAETLPSELYAEALEVTRQIQDESSRSTALIELAEALSEVTEGEIQISRLPYKSSRTSTLSKLSITLPPESYKDALDGIRQIQDESSRTSALIELAETLPSELYAEALEVTRQIQDESSRSSAISAFIKHWAFWMIKPLLEEARAIKEGYCRATTFSALLPRLSPKAVEFSFWQELLEILTCRSRKDFIADIPKLQPILLALGGEAAVHEVVQAMREVCEWWP